MKKLISLLLGTLILFVSFAPVYAAGGGVMIGDDNSETLFTGSASSHYLLLSSSGVVSALGDNTFGQCGAQPCDELTQIQYINFENKIVKVLAGNGFSLALDENHAAWGWGNNQLFQLGIAASADSENFSIPQKITEKITDIAAGENFSALLTEDGNVLLSGLGNSGVQQLLQISQTDGQTPKIKSIAANYDHLIAIGENNLAYHWQSDMQSAQVIEFPSEAKVQAAAAGKEHLVFQCQNGEDIEFYTLGDNSKHQLGVSDISEATEPVLALSLPYEGGQKISLFAGDYNTIVNCWSNLSPTDYMDTYCWGTDCPFVNIDQTAETFTAPRPENRPADYQIIALGPQQNLAFHYMTSDVMLFGGEAAPHLIPLIEPAEPIDTMYPYQYEAVDYHTYNVNFVKLNEEKFQEENIVIDEGSGTSSQRYSYWEFVNETQFRVKIKDFINGLGSANYNPAISVIQLSRNVTGENRLIGTYGPTIWNFNRGSEDFQTQETQVIHGSEDGTELTASAYTYAFRETLPLNIPSQVNLFYEAPGEITENTKLGLYLYGLPSGTTAAITDIQDNTFKITLSGNSADDLDYDSTLKLCYVRTEDNQTGGVVGDYDLNTVYAGEQILRGFTIKAVENTPETLTIEGSLTKGREDGKVISVSIAGGIFAQSLSPDGWKITGLDGVTISAVERMDDTNVQLTLSGNSSDRYTDAELGVICTASQYSDSRVYDETTGEYTGADLSSENSITVTKQVRSSGGSSGSTVIPRPTASVASGEVTKGTKVELSTTANNAKIYYTTDGSQPTEESSLYQGPIEITQDITIKFIAVSGSRKSSVQTVTYTVKTAAIHLKENADELQYIDAAGDFFHPDEAMTRYEILSALSNLFEIEDLGMKADFTDVAEEYSALVDLFVGAGIIEGYPDDTFRGDSGITRAEFVKILSIMLSTQEKEETAFSDIAGHWCETYINGFAELNLVQGYPDGNFRPDEIITKAEVVTVLNRVAKKDTNQAEEVFFDDVPENHWAYQDICAAVKKSA